MKKVFCLLSIALLMNGCASKIRVYSPVYGEKNSAFDYANAQCESESIKYHAPVHPSNPQYTCNTFYGTTTCTPSPDFSGIVAAAQTNKGRQKIYDACMLRHGWKFSHYEEKN